MVTVTSGIYSPKEVRKRVLNDTWVETGPLSDVRVIKPSSASGRGTTPSVSIGTNGTVSFSNCYDLEIRGIFSSEYDHYWYTLNQNHASIGTTMAMPFLNSGGVKTDSYTGTTSFVQSTTKTGGIYFSNGTASYANIGYGGQPGVISGEIFVPYNASLHSMRSNGGAYQNRMGKAQVIQKYADSYSGVRLSADANVTPTLLLNSGTITFYGLVK